MEQKDLFPKTLTTLTGSSHGKLKYPLPPLEFFQAKYQYNPETGKITLRSNGDEVAIYRNKTQALTYYTYQGKHRGVALGRLAYLLMEGEFPPAHIDHIDGNPWNNKWNNLRAVSQAENMRNRKLYGKIGQYTYKQKIGKNSYERTQYRITSRGDGKKQYSRSKFCDAFWLQQAVIATDPVTIIRDGVVPEGTTPEQICDALPEINIPQLALHMRNLWLVAKAQNETPPMP